MTCHLTDRSTDKACGETLIEVGDVMLCPTCDVATITQIRTKAF